MTKRRFIVSALARIAAGLALSVGIAWAFAAVGVRNPTFLPVNPTRWPVSVPADWPESPTRCEMGRDIGTSTCFAAASANRSGVSPSGRDSTSPSRCELTMVSTGWPFRCMQGEWRWVQHEKDGVPISNAYTRVDAPFAERYLGGLPLRPLIPGLVGNTAFFGAMLGLAAWLSHRLRAWQRTRKGLCPGCAYPFGVSPCCTECGRDISGWLKTTPAQAPRAT